MVVRADFSRALRGRRCCVRYGRFQSPTVAAVAGSCTFGLHQPKALVLPSAVEIGFWWVPGPNPKITSLSVTAIAAAAVRVGALFLAIWEQVEVGGPRLDRTSILDRCGHRCDPSRLPACTRDTRRLLDESGSTHRVPRSFVRHQLGIHVTVESRT